MILIFNVPTAPAVLPPARELIDQARIQRDLSDWTIPAKSSDKMGLADTIVEQSYALRVGEHLDPSELEAARVLSRVLFARSGAMTWLHSSVRGQAAPGFNARLLDDHENVLVNLRITKVSGNQDPVPFAADLIDQAARFSEPAAWENYLMGFVRTLGRVTPGTQVSGVVLPSTLMGHYRFLLLNTRRLLNVYRPGSRRLAWVLIWIEGQPHLNSDYFRKMAELTARSSAVPVMLVVHGLTLHTLSNGLYHQETLDPCQAHLDPADVGIQHVFTQVTKTRSDRIFPRSIKTP